MLPTDNLLVDPLKIMRLGPGFAGGQADAGIILPKVDME
jgi:hypothetical protein